MDIHSIKKEILALAILIPLALVLWGVFGQFSQPRDGVPAGDIQSEVSPQVTENTADGSVAGEKQGTVQLIIEYPDGPRQYQIMVSNETTVAEILQTAEETHGLAITSKDYGGDLGLFIEGFNGVMGDVETGLFWQFYINGALSPTGVSSATVVKGDIITWKYEPTQQEE